MLLLVAAALLAVARSAGDSLEDLEFHAWKLKFGESPRPRRSVGAAVTVPGFPGRSYSSPSEEAQRRQVWLSNRKHVLVHNILADQGIKSYRQGMTQFADMVGTGGFSIFDLLHTEETL